MGIKKIYISGKITDNPNYKADFEAAELALKIAGFQPVNPAEEHLPDGATWADYMRHDLKLLCDCDAIYMLNGWRESAGARIEHKLARDLGMEIIYGIKKPVYNAEYRRAQYMKNREETLKKQKEYYDQHREKILQKQKEYDDQHREEKLKKRKEYYNQHREETLKKRKEYYDQRREEIKRKARARYRAKCGLPPLKEGL